MRRVYESERQVTLRTDPRPVLTFPHARRLKVFDLVIRHLVVRVDEEEAVVDRTRSKRTEESRRRRTQLRADL